MELFDGPTLAELIQKRRGLPLDEVLPIAPQIAEALETAHERGIVHRDLKPANVKVRDDGTVKVLDFGLAKALSPENATSSVDAMTSPTLTAQATQLGIILGTAAYMAPEQAKGKHVDRRADIWAFGVVLYEMLTGQHGYEAEDVSDTLAAVLTRDVDWNALPTDVPPRLLALVRDCLVRDPRQRLRDIGDARRVLIRSSPACRIRRQSSRRRNRKRDPRVLERCHGAWRPLRWRAPQRLHSFTSARRPRRSKASDSRYVLLKNRRSLHSRSLQTGGT